LHDAVQIEAHGVPAVLLITEPFWKIVESFAPTVGAPGYSSVVAVPHPVSSKGEDELRRLAESIVDEVERHLVG
jgi:hypothetical protein